MYHHPTVRRYPPNHKRYDLFENMIADFPVTSEELRIAERALKKLIEKEARENVSPSQHSEIPDED